MSEIIVVYKEVYQEPILIKIENSIESFEKIIGGEIRIIEYENYIIVCRKDNKNLKPNIYVRTDYVGIGETIRGNLFLVNRNSNGYYTLNKEQAVNAIYLLKNKAFNNKGFDGRGKYIGKRKKIKKYGDYEQPFSMFKNDENRKLEDNTGLSTNYTNESENGLILNSDEVFKMLLSMQSIILKFIKEHSN